MHQKPATYTVKPSDSVPPTAAEISRVSTLLAKIRGYIDAEHNEEAVSTGAHDWAKSGDDEFNALTGRLFRCQPEDLRFFRFLCRKFSGYSLYHRANAAGTHFPDVAEFNDNEADRYWKDTAFLEDHYRLHMQLTFGLPPSLIFQPPLQLGEAGWMRGGRFISMDQLFYQERVSLLYYSGLIDYLEAQAVAQGEVRILEIGGGYGALALALKNHFPRASYTIVDLPASLAYSATYLSLTRPDLALSVGPEPMPFGFRLAPAALAEQLTERFDLIINTLSMCEMAESQVGAYCQLIKNTWIKESGFFFEQNYDNRNAGQTYPELIIEKHLQKTAAISEPPWGFLRGQPIIWKNPSASDQTELVQKFPSFAPIPVIEINRFKVLRIGCEYVLTESGNAIGRTMSFEEALSYVSRAA